MKLFDRKSADALIAELTPVVIEIRERHREMAALHRQLRTESVEPGMLWVVDESGRITHQLEQIGKSLAALVGRIEAMGGVVKDLDLGLVDFPGIVDREPVYLCWRLGETEIRFYHGVEEGFGGRRLLPGRRSLATILIRE